MTEPIEDLSLRHGPVTGMFKRPAEPQEWDGYRLREDQVRSYQVNGYLENVRLLSEEQCDLLCEELEEFLSTGYRQSPLWYEYHANESSDPGTVLFHGLGAWRIKPGFHDILWNPSFLVPASQLLGGAVRFWHDQLFCKPRRHGGVVAWHQDYSYWTRSVPLCHLTCWIALDDSSEENGCLHYVPGSHTWPLLPRTDLAGNMTAILEVLTPEQKQAFQPKPVVLERGCASFHHPLLLHGSYANRSDRPRRAVVLNTARDGFLSASDAPLLEGVPVIPKGDKIEGRFFPLLYQPGH
jgi:hypothetical protein